MRTKKKQTQKERTPATIKEFKKAYADGFRAVVYVTMWKGRRFIAEISWIKNLQPPGMCGFSYMNCDTPQREMRWLENCIKWAQVPIDYRV